MELSVVLFDLDQTLFDHRGSASRALNIWLASLDVVGSKDLTNAWFTAEDRHFPAWVNGIISFSEQRRRRLRDFLPLVALPVGTDEDLDALFAEYLNIYRECWEAFPDAGPALTAMHDLGLRTAVLTNGESDQQTAKLAAIGLLDRVGPVITSKDLGVAKPHRAAFELACARLEGSPARVLYVGDDHVTDVLAARAAGLPAVQLDRSGQGPLSERDRISSLEELSCFIAKRYFAGRQ
jgi:putative hydrolase of the HAD superfamily